MSMTRLEAWATCNSDELISEDIKQLENISKEGLDEFLNQKVRIVNRLESFNGWLPEDIMHNYLKTHPRVSINAINDVSMIEWLRDDVLVKSNV